jgi:hypothetical protein
MLGKKISLLIICLILVNCSTHLNIRAEAEEEINGESNELADNVNLFITLSSSVLAVVLFITSFVAYTYDRRSRFLLVMAAFFLFAVKGVLIALDDLSSIGLLTGPIGYYLTPFSTLLEPISRFLDFGVLILFFLGLIRK